MLEYFKINNHFKKYLPIFMIMLSIILLMGTSYALLRSSQQGENPYVMNVGLLEVTFQDSETNALTVENMVPVTDEEGQQTDKELVFTVKNTGTLPAMYNIYIEETSTNPEFKTVIRYISNKDDTGYNAPKTLSENNFIDTMATLDVGETATYKVKVWLDESADATYMNKTFTARVVVDVIQDNIPANAYIERSINNSTCNPAIEEDGTIYLSGDNDCVDFNYVWYSGKLWRITAINPDGTMKMITDGLMTSIAYGDTNKFYTDENTTSYVYQWLNQEFLPTLYNYENIIVEDAIWNASPSDGEVSTKLPVEGQEEISLNANVGLLNSYEYYMSYKNTLYNLGYLNIGYFWWLLNPYSVDSINSWYVYNGGDGGGVNSISDTIGIRPSVKLKSTIKLTGGTGTIGDPYTINGDRESAKPNITLLNTRTSGEYVNFNKELYRIIGTEDGKTKLIKADYMKDENEEILVKKFASSVMFGNNTNTQTDDYWDYYLNNTWKSSIEDIYENMLEKGTYYTNYLTEGNYKGAVCSVVSSVVSIRNCDKTGIITWTGYVGFPRYGEMFASQTRDYVHSNAVNFFYITPYSSMYTLAISYNNYGYKDDIAYAHASRPTIHLKSTIKITGGDGTESSPFEIALLES